MIEDIIDEYIIKIDNELRLESFKNEEKYEDSQNLVKEIVSVFSGHVAHLSSGLNLYIKADPYNDLKKLRQKLMIFKEICKTSSAKSDKKNEPKTNININNSPQFNNTNNIEIDINSLINQSEKQIKNSPSLDEEEIKQALDILNQLKEVLKEKTSKHKKWEKIKGCLSWLADKSVDVAISLLPILTKAVM